MNKILRGNIYFLIIMLVSIFGGYIAVPVIQALGITNIGFRLMATHFMFFIIPAIIYMIVTKSKIKSTLRLNKLSFKNVGYIVLIAILSQPIMSLCAFISNIFFDNTVGEFMGQISDMPYWQLLLIMAVTPAISEELTMRGVILSNYDDVSPIKASIITGILFGIFHMNPQQFLYAAVLGFLMAYLVRITNSILASAFLHFLINGWSVTVQKVVTKVSSIVDMDKATEEANNMMNNTNQVIAFIIQLGIMAIVGGILIYIILRAMKKNQNDVMMTIGNGEINEGNISCGEIRTEFKDSIINYIPIFVAIIIYFGYVALDLFLKSNA